MPNNDTGPEAGASLLQILREATARSHEEVDSGFSHIDLRDKNGYARFLSAHLIGMSPIFPILAEFSRQELLTEAPDFPEMLRGDLADLEVDPSALPVLDPPKDATPAAVCYVLAGSRLGIASIRTGEYWPKGRGIADRYMEDRTGLAVWRALVAWMRDREVTSEEAERHCASATAAFGLFLQALSSTRTQAA